KVFSARRRKPKRRDGVVPKNDQKDNGDVKEVTMQILQDEGKTRFAAVPMGVRFADGASRRVKKESAVISFAIVITGRPKSERRPENQHRRRQRPPLWLD